MNYILETERLRLREFTIADKKFIIELLNSPGWIEFIGDRNIRTEEQAEKYLAEIVMRAYRENGYGLSVVELKENAQPIGSCGIIKREDLEKPDIGFAFLPEFMGAGYAYEIAQATMLHALHVYNLGEIWAITTPHNARSIKLLEKIGMKFSKIIKWKTDEDLMLFSNKNEINMENESNTADRELKVTRLLNARIELVWKVWTNPDHIKNWWGPNGFTNTITKMDVEAGGEWDLIMHGPDGTDYKNKSVFKEIVKHQKIVYEHITGPKFIATITLESRGDSTFLSWHMLFPTKEEFEQVVKVFKADEGLKQNIEKLSAYLKQLTE